MDEDWKVGTSVTFSVNGKKVKGQLTKRLFRTLTYFLIFLLSFFRSYFRVSGCGDLSGRVLAGLAPSERYQGQLRARRLRRMRG